MKHILLLGAAGTAGSMNTDGAESFRADVQKETPDTGNSFGKM